MADGVLTYLFSDIEGSTQLWERQPALMQAALPHHDALARAAVQGHGGRLVRTMGDGIYAVFEDPARAVAAVLQLQLGLSDAANTAGLPLRVRCGLHRGEAEHRDGDFYGSTVNRAARIMSIGHGGQTLLSQAVAERVAEQLPDGASLLDLGRVRLRDLTSPERVWQLQHAQLRTQFPPLRSLEATPNNLPQQLNSFVGREQALVQARQQLAASRLVTLLGMGGIGKSRLSVQLGAEVLDDFPDGVWLVELAPLTDPRSVAQAVASVLGVKEDAGKPLLDGLLQHVRDRQLLVILDNCEHVLQACAELAKQLLQAGGGVKVLASSRTVLQVAGEQAYPVPTLSVPDPAKAPTPAELLQHEAVRLFVDRAQAAQPAFRVTAANAAAVADICHRLDGIPLAIELAAARTRALPVQAISDRLSDRFRLLVTRDETVLPRQRTLRALIDWSHDLLPEAESVLFRRLAVFAGGWTLEAAEQVGAGDVLHGDDVLDLLTRLVEMSLVVAEVESGRYRMLDTVRAYAHERLAQAADDDAATRGRHLQHYLAFAETARPLLVGPEQAQWLTRLDHERENLLSAHRWSEGMAEAGELGLRMSLALRPYWVHRGLLSLGLGFAVQVLSRKGLQERNEARCRALGVAGQMCNYVGRYAEARRYMEESLAIARERNDTRWADSALRQLGAACLGLGDIEAASACMAESVTLARQFGDKYLYGAALTALATLHRTQGRLAEALPLYQEALELAIEVGDRLATAATLLNLAMVAIEGPLNQAPQPMLLDALDIAEETASPTLLQGVLDVCAGLAAQRGDWAQAGRFFGAAKQQSVWTGLKRDAADEAFLSPRMERVRQTVGEAVLAQSIGDGAAVTLPAALDELRGWLASAS